jgi:hypothetical protein
LILLAILLNISGGPLAFAHSGMLDGDHSAAQMPAEHCAGHDSQPADDPPPAELPCCAGGHCACPAVSVFLPSSVPTLVRFARFMRADDLRLGEPPAATPSDPLRPPIV